MISAVHLAQPAGCAEVSVGVEFIESIIKDLVFGSHAGLQGFAPDRLLNSV